jgi:FkbM family methyltransferase
MNINSIGLERIAKNMVIVWRFLINLNRWNKIRFLYHLALTLFFRFTGKRLQKSSRIKILDVEYDVTIGNGELDIIYHTNILEEYMPFKEFIPSPEAVCIDIGANIGSTSLAWTKTLRTGRIYAIEPHPETYKTLVRNIQLNGAIGRILPYQFAMGSEDGEISLFISDEGSMAMRPGSYKWHGREISIPSRNADSFIEEEGIKYIDILKMDIEGYELEALRGAREVLKITKRIVLEYHSYELYKGCLEVLEQSGFMVLQRGSLLFGIKRQTSPVMIGLQDM